MGRPRLGKHLKKPSDYTYFYSESKAVGDMLTPEDKKLLAKKTKYSFGHIMMMCSGNRRMTDEVTTLAMKLIEINKLKEEV